MYSEPAVSQAVRRLRNRMRRSSRRPRGDGTRGPHTSSAARSQSTGLCNFHLCFSGNALDAVECSVTNAALSCSACLQFVTNRALFCSACLQFIALIIPLMLQCSFRRRLSIFIFFLMCGVCLEANVNTATRAEAAPDPKSQRRSEIAALSEDEYNALEAANVAALGALPNVSQVDAYQHGNKANQHAHRTASERLELSSTAATIFLRVLMLFYPSFLSMLQFADTLFYNYHTVL